MMIKQVYDGQVRLRKESDIRKESESSKEREIKTKRIEKNNSTSEKKEKKQTNFYARESEIKKALFSNQPMIILLYKEACFNANEINSSLPSVVVSMLQDYDDVFPNEIPNGLPPIRGIEHPIMVYHK